MRRVALWSLSEENWMNAKKLDVRGLKCPLPIVKAKQEIEHMASGDQLEVMATDPGSVPDFQGWVKVNKKVSLRSQRTETDDSGRQVYIHLLERLP
jgi:TusA-related sulfurtransferase